MTTLSPSTHKYGWADLRPTHNISQAAQHKTQALPVWALRDEVIDYRGTAPDESHNELQQVIDALERAAQKVERGDDPDRDMAEAMSLTLNTLFDFKGYFKDRVSKLWTSLDNDPAQQAAEEKRYTTQLENAIQDTQNGFAEREKNGFYMAYPQMRDRDMEFIDEMIEEYQDSRDFSFERTEK